MFDFLKMMNNYENRKVARFESETEPSYIIDTCAVTDNGKGFETGIAHPYYNKGEWVIVEEYFTKEEALVGHEKWVEIMENPPSKLNDVSNSTIAILSDMGGDWREKPKTV